MRDILVLGIGNRLMADDGIGVFLVEALQQRQQLEPESNIRFVVGESDIDYCLSEIEGAGLLLLVDAVKSGKTPGELAVYHLEKYGAHDPGISAHDLHLFQMIPHMYPGLQAEVIGIEAERIEFGLELSEALQERFGELLQAIFELIKAYERSE
ncbi:hydrogenase maturation protease [Paenibacillus sp. GCM10012303]|jgi:hydrogenase maturation protease|uniref:hydrogenase maturation protease n=1 Tax=Paenibacillus sp. GCM10012303 TaxID=3317340 RepID=UPI00360AF849